ncbi:phage GP46 family protein [Photorhabdus stackebrandtii]|uniref:Phage tail protein n=1 Tax=Photorhabdus stackebrandtii TaxID=1123042 RepID=A0A7X5QMS9_9GAMM|nr:phage GP46 family protein [Photorhabdus stackebrandtii]NHB97019.1 hypothetical protein [Photorhabdus stackebrandtii]
MSDITSYWDVNKIHADWLSGNGDLVTGNDLQTAIIISLFTDRQARPDDEIDGVDRKGWWGDIGSDYQIGSRLWLIRRQKLTTAVALKTEDYAREALQWMLDDGDALDGEGWPFTWRINAPETTIFYAVAGGSYCGDPLRSWGNKRLECQFNRLCPSHTILQFGYSN